VDYHSYTTAEFLGQTKFIILAFQSTTMLKCFIVDDEESSREVLKDYIAKVSNIQLVGEAQNPIKALDEINSIPDLNIVFLDVEMPELSGMTLVNILPKSVYIILTTAHAKHAVVGFEKDVGDFLLKPFSFDKFVKVIQKARQRILDRTERVFADSIFLNTGIKGKVRQVKLTDIIFMETSDHTIYIHTTEETLRTRSNIKEIEKLIPESEFFRIHRSFIINIKFIKTIDANNVFLIDGKKIPIGEAYKQQLLKKVASRTLNG